jgi:hypothetical protein
MLQALVGFVVMDAEEGQVTFGALVGEVAGLAALEADDLIL